MVSKIKMCDSCEGNTEELPEDKVKEFLKNNEDWKINSKGRLSKEFKFNDFKETLSFVNKVGKIAEILGHHPDIYFTYGKCTIEIYTHSLNRLSKNDFELAKKIDGL